MIISDLSKYFVSAESTSVWLNDDRNRFFQPDVGLAQALTWNKRELFLQVYCVTKAHQNDIEFWKNIYTKKLSSKHITTEVQSKKYYLIMLKKV